MREAMRARRPAGDDGGIAALQRDPARYLGFVEVHIEQGPVLNELDLPLGIVTSINGGVRYLGEVDRHGQPRRHHADGPPPRRRRGRGRTGAVRRAARRAGRRLGRHRRHARGAQRLDQRGAGPLPLQPRHARARPTRSATRWSTTCCAQLRRDLRAPRRALHARGDHARRRRAERARLAAALGARGRRARPAAVPHAQRRRPRRDEAARGDAAGHAVRARPERRHQPQPAGIDHQRRHPAGGATPSSTCSTTSATNRTATHHDRPRATRRLDRRPLRRGSALPAGAGARADRHAARQQRAARRAHRRAAGRLRLRGREARGARRPRCRRTAWSRSPT